MPLYAYEATSSRGNCITGYRFALSVDAIYQALKEEGLLLIHCQENFETRLLPALSNKAMRIPKAALIDFCCHMAQLDEAGVPLATALQDLALSTDHKGFRTLLHLVHQDVQAGIPLSMSLTRYPKIFDPIFPKVIRAAEQTGAFAPQFRHLETHLRRQEAISHQMQKALRVPVILFGLMVALAMVMTTTAIPPMRDLFASLGGAQLPLSTRLLLHLTNFLTYLPLGSFFLVGMAAFGYLLPQGRVYLARVALKLPLYHALALNHFWHVFAVLIGGGVDLLPSLDQAVQVVRNPYLRRQLGELSGKIAAGASLSQAFQDLRQADEQESLSLSAVMVRLLQTSEQTGRLRDLIPQAAAHYQTQTCRQMETLVSWLEPALILIMGGFMLWIVLAAIVPFYEMIGSLP